MERQAGAALAALTTLRLGGPARELVTARTETELVDAVAETDAAGEPLLLLGGGSNLVVADDGFDGVVVRVATRGVDAAPDGTLTLAAGEDWDTAVARAVDDGLAGFECLAGIPGLVGATPVQNVGAYGQEVGDTLRGVRVWDRAERRVVDLPAGRCGLGYRTSVFKRTDRYVVLTVTFGLRPAPVSGPLRYAELARALGIPAGASAPVRDVRAAVLGLRRSKGMVLDPGDHDTWSAGSFFTNPVVGPDAVPAGAPAWPQPDGRVKTSAAWLIEAAGVARGHRLAPDARVAVSGRHSLALTNRGGGTAAELLALARDIRDRVRDRHGIELEPEPRLVGVSL